MVSNKKIMGGGLLTFAPLFREVIKNVHLQFAQSSALRIEKAVERLHPFFNNSVCIFHRTEEAISFAAQVAVVFCLLVQLEGRGKESWRVAVIRLVKIKAFCRDIMSSISQ